MSIKKKSVDRITTILSLIISILALIASFWSVWATSYRMKFDLRVSVVNANYVRENEEIHLPIVFHNRGNIYGTIVGAWMTFDGRKKVKQLTFKDKKEVFSPLFEPKVLAPGEQFIKIDTIKIDFRSRNLFPAITKDNKRFLYIDLVVRFVDGEGLIRDQRVRLGHLIMTSSRKPVSILIENKIITLKSDSPFSELAGNLSLYIPMDTSYSMIRPGVYDSLLKIYHSDSITVEEILEEHSKYHVPITKKQSDSLVKVKRREKIRKDSQ